MIPRVFLLLLALGTLTAAQAQCGDTTHSATATDSWVSCQPSPNPHGLRGSSHWIQYDFGYLYTLTSSHVWNANLSSHTDRGLREVVIDYSLDGQQWTELGTYEWAEASGYQSYQGEPGPDFGEITARYVLITALNNHGAPGCYGLSEIRFDLNGVTSAQVVAEQGPLGLFPNPTSGSLRVSLADLRPTSLRVVDLQGRIMQAFEGTIPSELDVSALPAGLYFVSVQGADGSYYSGGFVRE
jgi:hypothetical protein